MTAAQTDVRVAATGAGPNGTWRQSIDALAATTLAHEPEWLAIITKSYRHTPLYLTGEDERGASGVLPAFIVRRPFFGTVVTSMPFLDSGGPVAASDDLRRALVQRLVAEARDRGARFVELRGTERLDVPDSPMDSKVNLTLRLPGHADTLWKALDGSVRNQIRKAERSGLSVEVGGSEHLDAFYRIFAARMRDLGSPVHGRPFLAAVFDAFGPRARLVLVRKGHVPVGGLVALTFKQTLAVPWAACLQPYFRLCPNMLLYWETIRTACATGLDRFEFGRSTRGSGTYRFKRQWGAEEQPLFWYQVATGSDSTRRPRFPGGLNFLTDSWRRLPLGLTRQLGPRIRRYLTQ
jgi:FemAB-related protein (PEP-CTERM system-associated)